MKKINKITGKLGAFTLILMITFLAACNGQGTPVNACHYTGDLTTPYEEIAITSTNLNEHLGHPNDIYPVPKGGCPTDPLVVTDGKVIICHATSSKTDPYDEISVNVQGLGGHANHAGDIIPMPEAGCPTTRWDITDGKITICHASSREINPYNEITVNANGLNGHDKHATDIIPAPVDGCPPILVEITDGKITICHMTGSETNPYNEITVSVNGLNGHDKHVGDIIPVSAGGCPTTKP